MALIACSNDKSGKVEINERFDIVLTRSEQDMVNQSNSFAFKLFRTIQGTLWPTFSLICWMISNGSENCPLTHAVPCDDPYPNKNARINHL